MHVCDKCGLIAKANLNKNEFTCLACSKSNIYQVRIPYACKLLFQELMSMCIAPRIFTDRLRPHTYMPTPNTYTSVRNEFMREDEARRMNTILSDDGPTGDVSGSENAHMVDSMGMKQDLAQFDSIETAAQNASGLLPVKEEDDEDGGVGFDNDNLDKKESVESKDNDGLDDSDEDGVGISGDYE